MLVAAVWFTPAANYRVAGPSVGESDPMIAAAGDIACPAGYSEYPELCAQRYTSDLLVEQGLAAVLPLGDSQYNQGSLRDYKAVYDPTWGRLKSITRPVPGNHDCDYDLTCSGYYAYFGAPPPYYSYDIGDWHLIALNGECAAAGQSCEEGSPQLIWLAADLATHINPCVLAYWHEPRWSSGSVHGSDPTYDPFWRTLYGAGVAVVLNGHEHNYERFRPMDPEGAFDPSGIVEFVVGTGGREHYPLGRPLKTSVVRDATTFGVLTLTLHADSYTWQFVNAPDTGEFTDSGSASCPPRRSAASASPGPSPVHTELIRDRQPPRQP
jgi:hypothetical protein